METKFQKALLAVIGYAGYLLLLTLAGIFMFVAICCLVVALTEGCLISLVAFVAAIFIASLCWSYRKAHLS